MGIISQFMTILVLSFLTCRFSQSSYYPVHNYCSRYNRTGWELYYFYTGVGDLCYTNTFNCCNCYLGNRWEHKCVCIDLNNLNYFLVPNETRCLEIASQWLYDSQSVKAKAKTTYATKKTDPLFENINGTSIKCEMECEKIENCSDSNVMNWYYGKNLYSCSYFQSSRQFYDNKTNKIYGYLEEFTWNKFINGYFFCWLHTVESYYTITPSYYFGLALNVSLEMKDYELYDYFTTPVIRYNLSDIDENTAKFDVYSTIPIECETDDGSGCELVITMTETYNNGMNKREWPRTLKNQETVNSSNKATWEIASTVAPLRRKSLTVINFSINNNTKNVKGNYWANIRLPTIIIYNPLIVNNSLVLNGKTSYANNKTDNFLKNVKGTSAKCETDCKQNKTCENMVGKVLWFTGKSFLNPLQFETSDLFYDNMTNKLYGYLEERKWISKINNYIFCMFNTADEDILTDPYYFGLILNVSKAGETDKIFNYYDQQEIQIELSEINDNKARLEVYSTIPMECKNDVNECDLTITMEKESIYSDLIRIGDGCSKSLKNQTIVDPLNKATWDIITTVEETNRMRQSSLNLELFIKGNPFRVEGDFWTGLKLPVIRINYQPVDMRMNSYAWSYNDPHMKSFDGSYFEFHPTKSEEYLMMENEATKLRIHGIFSNNLYQWIYFVNHIALNDRLYIQSVDDLIVHEFRYGDSLFYADLSDSRKPYSLVQIPFDANGNGLIPKQNAVQVSKINGRFKIITHFATTVSIDISGNFEVFPSKMDLNNVWGILGNYDKNPNNDFTELNGKTVQTMNEFFEEYRIENTNRPRISLGDFYNVTDDEKKEINEKTTYCTCTKAEYVCPLGLTQKRNDKFKLIDRRSLQYATNAGYMISLPVLKQLTDSINNFAFEKQLRKKQIKVRNLSFKRSINNATDACESALNIPVLQSADDQELLDINQLINNCINDSLVSNGSSIWAGQYYESALSTSKTILLGDRNTFVNSSDGEPQPQIEMLAQLCKNNCSYNGKCSEGTCVCEERYDGDDCSVDKSIPPIIYGISFTNNLCDSTLFTNCSQLIFSLSRITAETVIEYEVYQRDGANSLKLIDAGSIPNVTSFSSNLLYAKLLDTNSLNLYTGSLSVLFYSLKVSDFTKSESLSYAIYKSECQECVDATNCYVKANTCDIDNICYNDGEVNPNDVNQICNHSMSKFAWTTKENNTTTLSAKIMAAIIVSTVVVVASVITSVIVVIHIIKNKLTLMKVSHGN